MSIVDKLIEFRKTQNPVSVFGITSVDKANLNVIAIEVLSWLKLERKRELWMEHGKPTHLKALRLNVQFPWCMDLIKLLQEENALSEMFCINENTLCFKETVSDTYAHELRNQAYEQYNPPRLMDR